MATAPPVGLGIGAAGLPPVSPIILTENCSPVLTVTRTACFGSSPAQEPVLIVRPATVNVYGIPHVVALMLELACELAELLPHPAATAAAARQPLSTRTSFITNHVIPRHALASKGFSADDIRR